MEAFVGVDKHNRLVAVLDAMNNTGRWDPYLMAMMNLVALVHIADYNWEAGAGCHVGQQYWQPGADANANGAPGEHVDNDVGAAEFDAVFSVVGRSGAFVTFGPCGLL